MRSGTWTANPDLHALTVLVRAGLDGTRDPIELPDGKLNWINIVTLALEHNVGGLLNRAVVAGRAPMVPSSLSLAVARHARIAAQRNASAFDELLRLRAALESAGIAAIPLKGPWLCQRLYGDLTSRTSRDIDFLIRKEAIVPALRVLAEAGYPVRPRLSERQQRAKADYAGQFLLHRDDGLFAIEPHWDLAPHTLCLGLNHDALWQRSGLRSNHLPTLAPEDELIMLCVHGFKEEWGRIKLIADLGQFIRVHPNLDWDQISGRMREQHVSWIVLAGLVLVSSVFGIDTPLTACGRRSRIEQVSNRVLERLEAALSMPHRVPPETSIYHVSRLRSSMRERRVDRVRYIWRTMLTPREALFQAFPLPDALFPMYYLIKPFHDYALLPCWTAGKHLRSALLSRKNRTVRSIRAKTYGQKP